MYAAFFIAWVTFSFSAHKLAKYYFQFVSRLCDGDTLAMTVSVLQVTGVQLLVCGVLAFVEVPRPDTRDKEPSLGVLFIVAIPHMFGALTTNYSMALIPAASTHLIKVMEPMVTAVIAWITVGVAISASKLLALMLVLVGAVGASWDPSGSTFRTHELGVQLALLSTLLYAARNVTVKHLLGQSVVFEAATLGKVSLLGAILLLPFCAVPCTPAISHNALQLYVVMVGIQAGSAVCHAVYTYVSTCVILQRITVIGYALSNVAKRVLVIVLLYIFGQRYYLSPTFVVVCCVGLLIYGIRSSQVDASHAGSEALQRPRTLIWALTVMLVVLASWGIITNIVPLNLNSQDTHQYSRLVDRPNSTDSTMKFMHNASAAVQEAQRIQLQIYKELIGHYKKAILVGLADMENKGDSAISIGEFEALSKLGIEVIYYCSIHSCGNYSKAKEALSNEAEPVVILTSGGGNTCIWKIPCRRREKLVQVFRDREILVFPQSVHFANTKEMKAHATAMKHPNITYLFRDHMSYNIFVNSGLFQYNKAVLCPDAAMQIGIIQPPIEPTHDIVWLKRDDIDSLHSTLPEFPPNLTIVVEDWLHIKVPSGENLKKTSYERLMAAFKFLSQGKVIISDRLHAHILSVLLGKPNVMLDNSYKKVSSFHNTWTPSVDNALLASNVTDALKKALYLLQKYY